MSKLTLEILHYIILVFIGVFVAHQLSDMFGVESYAISAGWFGMLVLFGWYLAFIVATDLALHKYLLKE